MKQLIYKKNPAIRLIIPSVSSLGIEKDSYHLYEANQYFKFDDWKLENCVDEQRDTLTKDEVLMINNIIWGIHMKSLRPIDEMDDGEKYKKYEELLEAIIRRFSPEPPKPSEFEQKMMEFYMECDMKMKERDGVALTGAGEEILEKYHKELLEVAEKELKEREVQRVKKELEEEKALRLNDESAVEDAIKNEMLKDKALLREYEREYKRKEENIRYGVDNTNNWYQSKINKLRNK